MCSPFATPRAEKTIGMIMQVDVVHIINGITTGKVSLKPVGREPILYKWKTPVGEDAPGDASELVVTTPGRYFCSATDATGAVAQAYADVQVLLPDAVVVTGYTTKPAKTGSSRDGRVEAEGHLLDWQRWLWSCGAETTRPILENAPAGTYVVTPLPVHDDVPRFISTAEPGVVESEGL